MRARNIFYFFPSQFLAQNLANNKAFMNVYCELRSYKNLLELDGSARSMFRSSTNTEFGPNPNALYFCLLTSHHLPNICGCDVTIRVKVKSNQVDPLLDNSYSKGTRTFQSMKLYLVSICILTTTVRLTECYFVISMLLVLYSIYLILKTLKVCIITFFYTLVNWNLERLLCPKNHTGWRWHIPAIKPSFCRFHCDSDRTQKLSALLHDCFNPD